MRSEHQDLTLFAWGESHAGAMAAPTPHIPCCVPDERLPHEFLAIRRLISSRFGRDAAITASQIAADLNLWPALSHRSRGDRVRDTMRSWLPSLGFAICGDPSCGYYRPADQDEWQHAIAIQESRLAGQFERLKILKQLAAAENRGLGG